MRNVFKWHLLNQWFKFKIILQKCSSWCPLQKLLNSMATRAKNKNIFEWYLFSHWQIQSKLSVLLFWNLHILNPLLNHRVNLEFNVAKTAFKPNYYPYKKSHFIFLFLFFQKYWGFALSFEFYSLTKTPKRGTSQNILTKKHLRKV